MNDEFDEYLWCPSFQVESPLKVKMLVLDILIDSVSRRLCGKFWNTYATWARIYEAQNANEID